MVTKMWLQEWCMKSITPVWFVANILHPRFCGNGLTSYENKEANKWIDEMNQHQSVLTEFIDFIGDDRSVLRDAFAKTPNCKLKNSVKAQILLGQLSEKIDLSLEILVLVPSSASLERVFSSRDLFIPICAID